MVDTKFTTILNESISNFQEVQKQLSFILQKLFDAETRRQQPQTPQSNEIHQATLYP